MISFGALNENLRYQYIAIRQCLFSKHISEDKATELVKLLDQLEQFNKSMIEKLGSADYVQLS